MTEQPDYRAWCERKGEKYVRYALETQKAQGPKAEFARYWLGELERDSSERTRIEDRRTARSAKNAAWAAAIAAMVAAICAVIAIVSP